GLAFLLRPPVICAEPVSELSEFCAELVILTVDAALCACHVPVQRPSPSEARASAGSLLEKVTPTAPLVRGWPQSSTMRNSTGEGHPVVTLKPVPIEVKTGSSLVAAQAAGCTPGAAGRAAAPAVTTSTSCTVCVVLSEKVKVTLPLYAPGESPATLGSTCTIAGFPGEIVPMEDETLNTPCKPATVARYETVPAPRVATRIGCEAIAAGALAVAVKTRPAGSTRAPRAEPAGRTLSTTVIVCGEFSATIDR